MTKELNVGFPTVGAEGVAGVIQLIVKETVLLTFPVESSTAQY
jgi:hypothetical protein